MCVPTQHQAKQQGSKPKAVIQSRSRGEGEQNPSEHEPLVQLVSDKSTVEIKHNTQTSEGKNQNHVNNPPGSEKLRRISQLGKVSRHKVEDLNDSEGIPFPSGSFLSNGKVITTGAISY